MQTIVLSDHTGYQLAKRERGRQQKYQSEMARYNAEIASRDNWIQTEYERQKSRYESELEVWYGKNWPQKLLYGITRSVAVMLLCIVVLGASVFTFVTNPTAWAVLLLIPVTLVFMVLFFPTREPRLPSREKIGKGRRQQTQPVRERAGEEDRVWQAGNEGENRISVYLSSRLDDDWTLISGYRGRAGEIDQILVGPLGVCAIEVKNNNGHIFVEGDTWKLDKYDRYGNFLPSESGRTIQDRGGRSPSAQVNGAVDPLEEFLSKRNQVRRISRAVILVHERAKLAKARGLTVDYISTLRDMNVQSLFPTEDSRLDRTSAASVVQHIQRDHEFHKNRSKRPRRRNRRRTSVAT